MDRLALGDRLLALGRDGDDDAVLWGRLWRFDALAQLGDIDHAEAELAPIGALAERLRSPLARWHAVRCRATIAMARGRFDDALVLGQQAEAAAARRSARGGVTTVRDLGDRGYLSLGLREAATADRSLPTVAAGPPITTPGGHCHFLGNSTAGVAGVRDAVSEHAERGVDVIKVMASGGNLTPGSRPERSQFGPDELRAAVEEAHRHGLPITAHAHGTQAILDALAAGVDGLEHVTFMTADGVDPVPDELLTTIATRPVTLGITLGMAPAPGAAPPPPMAVRLPALLANVRLLHQTGASMIAGTDAGLGPRSSHPTCCGGRLPSSRRSA